MGFIEELKGTKDGRKAFERERVLFEATELIASAMEDQGLSKADLARLLGTRKSYITQLLSGEENMTLAKVSDVLFELKQCLFVASRPIIGEEEFEVVVLTQDDPWLSTPNFKWPMQPPVVGEGVPQVQVA